MTQSWTIPALIALAAPPTCLALYTVWVCYQFLPTIMRVFEETPLFVPPNEPPDPGAENVRFQTSDGLWLQGSWFPPYMGPCRGTIVFCHEYLSNRWSCRPYAEPLRESGFQVFAFDFRNHGESQSLPGYDPMQWATAHEVVDLRAALAQVRGRVGSQDHRIGLLGISRGGSAGILAAALDPSVRAVVTDGAFPTHFTQFSYMIRWAGIYAGHLHIYQLTPSWYYSILCWIARFLGGRRHGCRFPRVERAVRKISPRPLLMIHGEKDSYIVEEIARKLFAHAAEPKEFWLVPGAKHNGAIQVAGEEYARRLVAVFQDQEGSDALGGA